MPRTGPAPASVRSHGAVPVAIAVHRVRPVRVLRGAPVYGVRACAGASTRCATGSTWPVRAGRVAADGVSRAALNVRR